MFGVEIEVNGQRVPAQVGTFTMLGRARMALRRLRGKRELVCHMIDPEHP